MTRDDWEHVQGDFEQLMEEFESLKVQLLPDGPLPWLARGIDSADAVNLLQGEFARTSDYAERWRQWRVAAILAVALLGVHVAAQALQIRPAKHESAALDGRNGAGIFHGHAGRSRKPILAVRCKRASSSFASSKRGRSLSCASCKV